MMSLFWLMSTSPSSKTVVVSAFQVVHQPPSRTTTLAAPSFSSTSTSSQLFMASLSPSWESKKNTVGILGRGYVAWLTAKMAAQRGYETWMICFQGQEDVIKQLVTNDGDETEPPDNLNIVKAADSDLVDEYLSKTNAIILAADDVDDVLNDELIEYICNASKLPTADGSFKRIVGMSRNLNGKGMGFFVSAARRAANSQVWDNSNTQAYQSYEKKVQECASNCNAEYTIVRAGTLKGGACGDITTQNLDDDDEAKTYFSQYLNSIYYDMTNTDVAKWQLLFDCCIRGVKLTKGDVLSGPGAKAVLTAISDDECEGDTSRGGIAEAMVRSLEMDQAGNIDFGIATQKSRVPPTDEEWDKLFQVL